MNKNYFSITIKQDASISKYIPIIRKYTSESIAEIKNKIMEAQPVIVCFYTNANVSLRELYEVLLKLQQLGAVLRIKEHLSQNTVNVELGYIKNLMVTYDEISKEINESRA